MAPLDWNENEASMKAFVTGATGFIGRRLVGRLIETGFEVTALVRREAHDLPPGVFPVHGDVLLPASLKRIEGKFDRLYHLASLIHFDPAHREELLRVNGEGTSNVLAASRNWDVERTVVVGSACTLGLSHSASVLLPADSTAPETLIRTNPYLESKLAAETAALCESTLRHVVVVSPSTVFGPGDHSLNSGSLIRKIALSPVVPVPPGGSNVVDVDDVVEGIIVAGERGRSGGRYVLGGENLRFVEIFKTVADVVGHRPIMVPVPSLFRRLTEQAASVAGHFSKDRFLTPRMVGDLFDYKFYSSELSRRDLGWIPRYSFRESVGRAWKFYRAAGLI